jgi:hypothetical protein
VANSYNYAPTRHITRDHALKARLR